MPISNDTMNGTAASDSRDRRTVASYPSYAEAEHAVDSLSDQGVAVEDVAIGSDFGYLLLYSVVTGGLFGVTIGLIEYG